MNAYIERMLIVVSALGEKDSDVAKKLGITRQRWYNLKTRSKQPRSDLLGRFLSAYPQVRGEWFLEGKGEKFRSQESSVNYKQLYEDLMVKYNDLEKIRDKLIEVNISLANKLTSS